MSKFQKLKVLIKLPYHVIKSTLTMLIHARATNPLTQSSNPSSGVKVATFSKDYSVNELKKKGRSFSVSINDILTTTVSVTLREYFY